ncbi:armadillo-type protein [Mycena epipterygia]|nr:armadillo-type protein [Mycena epipterygia]
MSETSILVTDMPACEYTMRKPSAIRIAAAWEAHFLCGVVVFGFTFFRSYRQPDKIAGSILDHMVRDGALYFAVLALVNLANILMYYVRSFCSISASPLNCVVDFQFGNPWITSSLSWFMSTPRTFSLARRHRRVRRVIVPADARHPRHKSLTRPPRRVLSTPLNQAHIGIGLGLPGCASPSGAAGAAGEPQPAGGGGDIGILRGLGGGCHIRTFLDHLLSGWDPDLDVVEGAIYALSRIAYYPADGAQLAVKENTLDHVCELLQSPIPKIRSWTCEMLGNLALHVSVVDAILALKPCEQLATLLQDANSDVRESAVFALASISKSPTGVRDIIRTGILEHVSELMDSGNRKMQFNTCLILRNLARYPLGNSLEISSHNS